MRISWPNPAGFDVESRYVQDPPEKLTISEIVAKLTVKAATKNQWVS